MHHRQSQTLLGRQLLALMAVVLRHRGVQAYRLRMEHHQVHREPQKLNHQARQVWDRGVAHLHHHHCRTNPTGHQMVAGAVAAEAAAEAVAAMTQEAS